MKKPLTLDEYLNARDRSPTRCGSIDCVMPCAGADAFLVLRRGEAEKLGLPYARILATIERHNAFPDDPIQYRGGWALDRDELYAQAGVGPQDIDVLATYDDYPVINADADRGSRLLQQGRRRRISSAAKASPPTARFRSTPPAANSRSARPARPAVSSVWSRSSGRSPVNRSAPRCRTRGLVSRAASV